MAISKPTGVTPTERLLADLCEKTFLGMWSYPSPTKDDGKELCDLLAVFDDHVFIFFDREGKQLASDDATDVDWDRWKRKVIDAQVATAHGAERYIRSGRKVFLDRQMQTEFPIHISRAQAIVHKIIVAHGAMDACANASSENVSGSLGISYSDSPEAITSPFMIDLDRANPVHVLDSNTLPLVLGELDTFFDLSLYLDEKVRAIQTYSLLTYCGEEDLLAHYYLNFDEQNKKHCIGPRDQTFTGIMIGEGEWQSFIERPEYADRKAADRISYLWDAIIQNACKHALAGTLINTAGFLSGRSAIHEMAREPRFMRRFYSQRIMVAIEEFPVDSTAEMVRHVCFFESFQKRKGYVFLQFRADGLKDYRAKRQVLLQIACGALRNVQPDLDTIVGIAVQPPKLNRTISEDFLLMDCTDWTDEKRREFEKLNEGFEFFKTASTNRQSASVKAFPSRE